MKTLFMNRKLFFFLVLLVVAAAFSRMIPHPANFTPLIAIALFSGCVFRSKWSAFVVPIAAMVVSDLFLGFHSLSVLVYVSMLPAVFLGQYLQKVGDNDGSRRLAFFGGWFGLGFLGDLIFFIMTNLGVWWFSGFYARSVSGLTECFVLALPFLKNQLLGTMTFLGLLLFTWYGLMFMARQQTPVYQRIPKD